MQRLIAKFNYHSDDLYIYKPGKGVVMTSTDRSYSIYGDKKISKEFPLYENLTVDIKVNSGNTNRIYWECNSPTESSSERILRNFIQNQIYDYQGSGTYKIEYLDPEIVQFIEANSEKVQVGAYTLPKIFYSGYNYKKNELIAATCNTAYYRQDAYNFITLDLNTKKLMSVFNVENISKVKDILYNREIETPEKD